MVFEDKKKTGKKYTALYIGSIDMETRLKFNLVCAALHVNAAGLIRTLINYIWEENKDTIVQSEEIQHKLKNSINRMIRMKLPKISKILIHETGTKKTKVNTELMTALLRETDKEEKNSNEGISPDEQSNIDNGRDRDLREQVR
jgi:hypothetical protein